MEQIWVYNRTILPCSNLCEAFSNEGCQGIVPADCSGPQYGPPENCFDLPLPEVVNNCTTLAPKAGSFEYSFQFVIYKIGLNFCSMVDYPVDVMLKVPQLDKNARNEAEGIITELSKQGQVSEECKSRLGDFMYIYFMTSLMPVALFGLDLVKMARHCHPKSHVVPSASPFRQHVLHHSLLSRLAKTIR